MTDLIDRWYAAARAVDRRAAEAEASGYAEDAELFRSVAVGCRDAARMDEETIDASLQYWGGTPQEIAALNELTKGALLYLEFAEHIGAGGSPLDCPELNRAIDIQAAVTDQAVAAAGLAPPKYN